MKKVIPILLVLFITFLVGCNNKTKTLQSNEVKPKKEIYLQIMTTNKLLYKMVKDITKEKHYVDYMFKNESDQWNFQFTEDSLGNISKQDLFFYVGAGFEPWANNFIDNLKKDSVGVVNISRGTTLIPYKREVKYKNVILKDNPYYWLNFDNYKVNMLNIKNAIEEKDPENRDYYEKNFSDALKQIDAQSKKLNELIEKNKDYLYLVDGEELDYFTKYNNLKTLDLFNYNSLTPVQKDEKALFEKKLKDAKGIIFLYKSDEELKSNKSLLNEYNVKTANIVAYKEDLSYNEIVEINIENLERSLNQ